MARREVEPIRISKETMRLYHYHLGIGSGRPLESHRINTAQSPLEQVNSDGEKFDNFERQYYEEELL